MVGIAEVRTWSTVKMGWQFMARRKSVLLQVTQVLECLGFSSRNASWVLFNLQKY